MNRPEPMGGNEMSNELNKIMGMVCERERMYYNAAKVDVLLAEKDKEIAELKARIQLDDDEMEGFLQLEEECGGGDLRNYIAELKDKCQMHDFFWEGCGFAKRGFKNAIAVAQYVEDLEAENERLRGESCKLKDGCLRLKQCRKEKANIADELRHQKRKRCLAMVKWCKDKVDTITNGYIVSNTQNGVMTTCPPACNPKFSFYSRWYKCWLELAAEPTWAKFLQLIHKEAK